MTAHRELRRWLSAALAFTVLTGFTGPQGGIGGTGRPQGGIGGTGVTAIGVIQRFGSIFVNGTEYRLLPTTHYRVDGRRAARAVLRLGDVVFVEGVQHDLRGRARRVYVQHALIGVITHTYGHGQRLTILGQRVVLHANTVRGHRSSGHVRVLRVGMEVAVSGLQSALGVWQATGVQVLPTVRHSHASFLIRGTLRRGEGHTLVLDGRLFNLASTALLRIANGTDVVARGVYRSGHPIITHVRKALSLADAHGQRVFVSGYLRAVAQTWRYEGMTLAASKNAMPGGVNPRNSSRPFFFVARRVAPGRFMIDRLVPGIHVMTYGLPPAILPPDTGRSRPHRAAVVRPHIPHARAPQVNRPQIMRPHLAAARVLSFAIRTG
ncbi:MAG: DUF5666 domain-containing protein [Acidiferrobacter sp.]